MPALPFARYRKDGVDQSGAHTADFTVHPDALPAGLAPVTLLAGIETTKVAARR